METLTSEAAGNASTPPAHQRGARLQMALARLGLFALETVDVPALIDESLREVVRQLDVEHGLVLRMRPDDGDALVIGSAGFSGELERKAALPAAEGTLAGRMNDAPRPVIVEDWGEEERFEWPALFDEEGMGYMLGAADYLTKPLNAERLVGVLRKYRSDSDPCSVMIVEDDETTRDLMRRTLEKQEGCAIYEAENGRAALEKLDEAQPDMIFLDLMMPKMDGFTFLDKKEERDEHRSVPVVVVTAKELTAEDRERLKEHAETVLQKGNYDRSELLNAVSSRVKTMTRG